MEDVLDLYQEPYDPNKPTVCFDEMPFQILGDINEPIPMKPGRVKRVDYEYERKGTCNFFVFLEPHTQFRKIKITDHRKNYDFAKCMEELVYQMYPKAEKIRVVLDNLSTHSPAALYQTFPPEKAKEMTRKLEFHYTPVHGSWLNMAEIEFSVLTRQCLKRRFPDLEKLKKEVDAWNIDRNNKRIQINWCFSTNDARIKFERLYPKN